MKFSVAFNVKIKIRIPVPVLTWAQQKFISQNVDFHFKPYTLRKTSNKAGSREGGASYP
jgi:hypothetical protein